MKRENVFNTPAFKALSPDAQKDVRNIMVKKKSITMRELKSMELRGEPLNFIGHTEQIDFMPNGEKIEQVNFFDVIKEEDRNKRYIQIAELRSEGKSLGEIGEVLGVTRERVRQLERVMGLPPRGAGKRFWRLKSKEVTCPCGKVMDLPDKSGRKYCSRECNKKYRVRVNRTPEEKRAFNSSRTMKYYHEHKNDPKQIARLARYRNDPRYKEYHKKWLAKKMSDPEWKARYIKRQTERAKQRWADPVIREKLQARKKERYAQNAQKYSEQRKERKQQKLKQLRDRLIEMGFDPKKLKQL